MYNHAIEVEITNILRSLKDFDGQGMNVALTMYLIDCLFVRYCIYSIKTNTGI